jgi:hypothetical protein
MGKGKYERGKIACIDKQVPICLCMISKMVTL